VYAWTEGPLCSFCAAMVISSRRPQPAVAQLTLDGQQAALVDEDAPWDSWFRSL
jgi:hypothetical protein